MRGEPMSGQACCGIRNGTACRAAEKAAKVRRVFEMEQTGQVFDGLFCVVQIAFEFRYDKQVNDFLQSAVLFCRLSYKGNRS